MREFGSLELVAAASVESLAKAGGMGMEVARTVKERLGAKSG
jgi:excinuclease UvrABC nuclease subunit